MTTGTRDLMLRTTARLLQQRGYHGTSISDVLAESGAPRGSLYHHFPGGKDQLAIEATRAEIDEGTRWLQETIESADGPPDAVRRYVEGVAAAMRDSEYTFGCPVAPLILDLPPTEELAALCREGFETWTQLLRDMFLEAGISERQAQDLAVLVLSSVEGLMLIARSYRDVGPLANAATALEAAVRSAMPASDARTGTTTV